MKDFYLGFISLVSLSLLLNTSCSNLPGNSKQQGAVIGGAGGAAAGAVIGGKDHRAVGALLGGILGAGGGYVIGANQDRVKNQDTNSAAASAQTAQTKPATTQAAINASTADLNGDGFVTLDEVLAMKNAGLTDQQMIQRLQATGHIFELTTEQQDYLISHGLSRSIVNQMLTLNRASNPAPAAEGSGVISQPR